tara:strand:- start:32861 stop:33148 length:288 start_codon:yes stop_codon:yes gene_type:complete
MIKLTAKKYLESKGLNNHDYMDSGMIDHISEIMEEYATEQLRLHGVGSCNGKKDENIENEYILIDSKDGLWDVYDKKGCLGMGLNNEEVNRITQK